MADKFSKGSNSSTLKNVSIDIGVIGYENCNIKKKKKKKKTLSNHISFEKEKFYVNSTEMYMASACLLK